MLKIFLFLLASVVLAGTDVSAAPQRVMAINLCADQLVLDLLPYDRITSVSWLAREGYGSYLAEKASHVAINHGTAEEVLRQRPDLVVAGLYTATPTRTMLKRVGIPVIELPPAENFDAVRANVHLLASALDAQDKAEAMLHEMDAILAELAASKPSQQIVIAGWDGSGQVPGPNTMFNSIVAAAGATNITASPANAAYVRFDLERLLFAHPDLLAHGDSNTSKPAILNESLRHPAIRKTYAGREFTYPELLYSCGLPQSARAAKELREFMIGLLTARAVAK